LRFSKTWRRARASAVRPGLDAAFAAVKRGDADGLIVSKLDRLSRSVRDFAESLARFQQNGWALVVMDLGVDTSTIMGAAMAQMVSVFSELERKRIAERTREALAVKKASGVRLGRPPTVSAIGRASHSAPTSSWRVAAGDRERLEPRSRADRSGRGAVVCRDGAQHHRSHNVSPSTA
jgi:DNA invertase Pin-like site-specific DNA recombinase